MISLFIFFTFLSSRLLVAYSRRQDAGAVFDEQAHHCYVVAGGGTVKRRPVSQRLVRLITGINAISHIGSTFNLARLEYIMRKSYDVWRKSYQRNYTVLFIEF